jgi:hypothetical protein
MSVLNTGQGIYYNSDPVSRHTYQSPVWLPTQQRVMIMGGACWSSGNPDNYVGWFDPVAGTWTSKAAAPHYGVFFSVYDNTRDVVWYTTWPLNYVYKYTPASDTHTLYASDPVLIQTQATYVSIAMTGDGHYLYATHWNGFRSRYGWPNAPSTWDNAVARLDLTQPLGTQTWQPIKVSGDTTGLFGQPPGFEWDPDKNAFVLWTADDPANMSVLRIADHHIYRVPIKGTGPTSVDVTATSFGVWGRFRRYGAHQYCLMASASSPIYLITLK